MKPKWGDYVFVEDDGWWEVTACLKTARLTLMRVGLSETPKRYWRAKWKPETSER
jgi:hypothetical protein